MTETHPYSGRLERSFVAISNQNWTCAWLEKGCKIQERNSKRFGRWNCNADDDREVKCPFTLCSKARRLIEEQDIVIWRRLNEKKRSDRFSDDEAYWKQGRQNESRDHGYNDGEDYDKYHTWKIHD